MVKVTILYTHSFSTEIESLMIYVKTEKQSVKLFVSNDVQNMFDTYSCKCMI